MQSFNKNDHESRKKSIICDVDLRKVYQMNKDDPGKKRTYDSFVDSDAQIDKTLKQLSKSKIKWYLHITVRLAPARIGLCINGN